VKRQVDSNWMEGERNAMIGIFPASYVDIVPEGEVSSLRSNKRANYSSASAASTSNMLQQGVQEGQAKVKFNFHAQTPMELSLVKGEHEATYTAWLLVQGRNTY
jgi:sorbin and SH3 domain-containing protein 1